MTDKQIIKLNELTEMSQELGLYEDRPDWRITLQADHIKRLEEELQAKEQECEELKDLADHNGRVCNKRLNKIDELEHDINELNGQLDQLKAENEQLKKAEEYDSRYNDMQAEIDCGNTIVEKYEKCLTEIKAFVQKEIEYFEHDIEYQYDWKELMKLIKINEVEDVENN